jgi:hypothetical protein
MTASGEPQRPVDNRHNKDGSLSISRPAEQQNMFSPAFQKGEGLFLYRRRLEYRCYPHIASRSDPGY